MNHAETKSRTTILDLLRQRGEGTTICPSEAARAAFPDDWRDHMDLIRDVARAMGREGLIEICQSGDSIDPDSQFRGPIRLRLGN